MPNPALKYDSDWDYHNDNLSEKDKIIQALSDAVDSTLTQEYINWMVKQRPQAVAYLLINTAEAHTHLNDFATLKTEEKANP